jgi:hypothetical protein
VGGGRGSLKLALRARYAHRVQRSPRHKSSGYLLYFVVPTLHTGASTSCVLIIPLSNIPCPWMSMLCFRCTRSGFLQVSKIAYPHIVRRSGAESMKRAAGMGAFVGTLQVRSSGYKTKRNVIIHWAGREGIDQVLVAVLMCWSTIRMDHSNSLISNRAFGFF